MDISVKDLQKAISIRQQIDGLQRRLPPLLRGAPKSPAPATAPTASGRYFSPATRAKLSAAARARWARTRGSTKGAAPTKRKGQLTAAGRRKLSQLMKARWAARRKAGGKPKASSRKKGALTPAGRKRLSELMKARWAARRRGGKKAAVVATSIGRVLVDLTRRSCDGSNCSREDSNLHGSPHTVLSRTRLPVPPREQDRGLTIRVW